MIEILPDSRARAGRGSVPSQILGGVSWVPIYCANCGDPGGMVPEENTTFAFWLCTPCFETHGEIAGMMAQPDSVFYEKVKQEQIEKYGRELAPHELQGVVDSGLTPLAALIKEGSR